MGRILNYKYLCHFFSYGYGGDLFPKCQLNLTENPKKHILAIKDTNLEVPHGSEKNGDSDPGFSGAEDRMNGYRFRGAGPGDVRPVPAGRGGGNRASEK